jgi:lipoate-protein ligase A
VRIWRLIADDGVGAAEGLAGDEALMLHHRRGAESPCEASLRLYTYAPHCALVGRYQSLEAELDTDACRALGVQVGRRATGGGAILMGPDQLGVAITTRAPSALSPRELLRRFAAGIITGLAGIGISAQFAGKNDLRVAGRKIAGLGLYVDERGALLFHASVLADLDVELMLAVLRIPGAKLSDKGAQRVGERITTVTAELGRPWSATALRDPIAAGFEGLLGVRLARSSLDEQERRRARELQATRYGAAAWLADRAPATDHNGTALLKAPGGLVRVYAGVQQGSLSSVMLTGDFSQMPRELLELEAALRWCRAERGRIAEVVEEVLDGEVLGVGADELAATIWAAAERALQRGARSAPVRASGSCYFPERQGSAEHARQDTRGVSV